MKRREQRAAAEMSLARIIGRRWGVAMCETEWTKFSDGICLDAKVRLLAFFDHFCDHGEVNLPRGAFRWLSSAEEAPGTARQGAFEARGVVVRGRAAPAGKQRMFFVTSIDLDPPAPAGPPKKQRGHAQDACQARLPLNFQPTERH